MSARTGIAFERMIALTLAKKLKGQEDEVVKIHRSLRPQCPLVERENLGGDSVIAIALPFRPRSWHSAGIFRPRDGGHHPPRVEGPSVRTHRPHQPTHQRQLVTRVGHGETLRPPQPKQVLTCHLSTQRMKGRHPHLTGGASGQPDESLLHFSGGLVGENNGAERIRPGAASQKPGNPVDNDARLPTPRPGQDEKRALGDGDGFALLLVEAREVHPFGGVDA